MHVDCSVSHDVLTSLTVILADLCVCVCVSSEARTLAVCVCVVCACVCLFVSLVWALVCVDSNLLGELRAQRELNR